MKIRLMFISLLAVCMAACSDISSGVTVGVRLEGEAMMAPVTIEFRDTTYAVKLDSRGRGEVKMQGNEGFGSLVYNGTVLPLYVDDKDFTVALFVRGNSMRPSFTGKGAKQNFYMSNARRELPAYELEETEFIEQLKSALEKAESRLDEQGFDLDFENLERVRLRYNYMGALPGYPVYHSMITKHDDTLSDAYYNELYALLDGNKEWLELQEYQNALMVAVNRIALRGIRRTDTSDFIIRQLQVIKEGIKDSDVASRVASAMAVRYINDRGIDDLGDYQSLLETLVVVPADRKSLDNAKSHWKTISKGCKVPSFGGLVTIKDKELKWEDYKGKYVYLLCWLAASEASVEEMKALQSLIKEYDDDSVEFIAIAGDGSQQYWNKVIVKNRFGGTQAIAASNRSFLEAMSVQLYPRAIVVDGEGKIASAVAPLPGSNSVRPFLNALPGLKSSSK